MKSKLAAFTIPAYENKWDLEMKANAVRKAGVYYLVALLCVVLCPLCWGHPKLSRCCHRARYRITRKLLSKERAALLSRHRRKTSDDDQVYSGSSGTELEYYSQ